MTSTDSPLDSLAGALVEANDHLLAMYDLATVTSSSLDEGEAVEEILARAKKLLRADSLTMFTASDAIESEDDIGSDDRRTTTARVDDASAGASSGTSTQARVAIEGPSDLRAVLEAKRSVRPFGTADMKLLTAIANMAISAVNTSRLHQSALSQAVVSRDYDTASELALLAVPKWRPSLPGMEFFARSDPARAAGGDLFTFAMVDDAFHFVVGDVSGKGLPAAMMMTTVISASTAAFQTNGRQGPAAVVASIDRWVYDYLSDAGLFVTLMAGSYEPATNRLRLANAGHGPVLLVQGDDVQSADATVPPIGVLPIEQMDEMEFAVAAGDRLVVASDGFTEQEDPSGVMFGEDRLAEIVCDRSTGADEFGHHLFDLIDTHAGGAHQSDDRTLIVLDILEQAAR